MRHLQPKCLTNSECTSLGKWSGSEKGSFGKGVFFRVALLQTEIGTKDFFRGANFLTKNALKIFPKLLSLSLLWVRICPAKFPPNFPQNVPPQNQKKKSPTSFCRSAGRRSFQKSPSSRGSREFSEMGRIRFRRVWFQTLSSVSFFAPHRVPGRELSEFLSAYYLCARANSPIFFAKLTEFAVTLSEAQRVLFSETVLETVFCLLPKFRESRDSRDPVENKILENLEILEIPPANRLLSQWPFFPLPNEAFIGKGASLIREEKTA